MTAWIAIFLGRSAYHRPVHVIPELVGEFSVTLRYSPYTLFCGQRAARCSGAWWRELRPSRLHRPWPKPPALLLRQLGLPFARPDGPHRLLRRRKWAATWHRARGGRGPHVGGGGGRQLRLRYTLHTVAPPTARRRTAAGSCASPEPRDARQ